MKKPSKRERKIIEEMATMSAEIQRLEQRHCRSNYEEASLRVSINRYNYLKSLLKGKFMNKMEKDELAFELATVQEEIRAIKSKEYRTVAEQNRLETLQQELRHLRRCTYGN